MPNTGNHDILGSLGFRKAYIVLVSDAHYMW